jgi:alpha-L-fucosidase
VNTSIRPEWFYHEREDKKVKTLPQLMDLYHHSIGRNGTLLLNFPIMPNGLIHEKDEKAVLEFASAIKEAFAVNLVEKAGVEASNIRGKRSKYNAKKAIDGDKESYWATDDGVNKAALTINFAKPTAFNRFLVQEYIRLGQRVKTFTVEALVNGVWKELAKETTIGYKRILRFPTVEATKLRFTITDSKSCPLISNIGVYKAPQILTPPTIVREQSGDIQITPADPESDLYYSLDGSTPTAQSSKYTGPIKTNDGKAEVKAIAYNPTTGKSSTLTEEKFDIARKNWKVLGIEDKNVSKVLDGNVNTNWHQSRSAKMPVELVIDLGKLENLRGFRYLPDQNWWAEGSIITQYQFFVSEDNQKWELVSEGEFANIKNNPFWQTKSFKTTKGRYIKLKALQNVQTTASGYAEIDVITE